MTGRVAHALSLNSTERVIPLRGRSLRIMIVVILSVVVVGAIFRFGIPNKLWQQESSQLRVRAAAPTQSPTSVTIKLLQTSNFGDDLSITLTDIKFDPETKKYKVWAMVAVRDNPNMQVRRAEEGYSVTYPEDHGFTIALLKAAPEFAKFSIVKNP